MKQKQNKQIGSGQQDRSLNLDVVHANAAGLDIGNESHYAAVPPDRDPTPWRSKTYLGAKFRRLRARLGAPKALTAMAHMLARLVYRMLRYGEQYVDKGMNYYEERHRAHEILSIQKKAKELGLQVILSPTLTA
jgi:hypothetical protein